MPEVAFRPREKNLFRKREFRPEFRPATSLRPATLLKMKFVKFLRTAFLTEHFWTIASVICWLNCSLRVNSKYKMCYHCRIT